MSSTHSCDVDLGATTIHGEVHGMRLVSTSYWRSRDCFFVTLGIEKTKEKTVIILLLNTLFIVK